MKINAYPHQMRALTCGKKRIAIMGGVGSGKSYTAAMLMITHALKHKTQVMALRRTAKETEKTLRADILEKWGDVISGMKSDQITLINGSVIHLVHGYDDVRGVSHLDGYNISCYWISQAEQMPVDTIAKLEARARNMGAGGEILEIIEGNPNGKDWIYERYCKGRQQTTKSTSVNGMAYDWLEWEDDTTLCLSVPTQDFPWLPKGYRQRQIEGRPQRWIDRYVDGKFDTYSGIVYDCFSEKDHLIKPFTILPTVDRTRFRRVIGIDWGFRNPCAVIWTIWDMKDDTFYFYREMYVTQTTPQQVAEMIAERTGDEVVDCILIDPSTRNDTGLGNVYDILEARLGTIVPAENDVKAGIDVVYEHLSQKRVQIFDTMTNFVNEITHYTYGDDLDKPGKTDPSEAPKKRSDHLMDAMKYIVFNKHVYKEDGIVMKRKESNW